MTINGSTNNIEWGYKLEVNEIATSVQNRTSTVEVKAYLGRTRSRSWVAGDFSGNIVVAGQTQNMSGTIPYQTWLNAGEYYNLATKTFVVSNVDNPTTITISSTMSSSSFTPSYGSANGSMQLTILHLNPVIETADMVETNSVLTALSVPNTTIVQYLSKKTITLHGTAYDDATIDKYRLRHFNTNYNIPSATTYQSSNVFNTDYTTNDISIGSGKANIIQDIGDTLSGTSTDWVYVNIGGEVQKPNGIAYTKPTIEKTNTSIKRKSGGGTTLTDNKAVLNLKATFYKSNDIIGNNNNIQQIGYKIWESSSSEPSSYTTLTPTISGSNITISDFVISNMTYTKTYYYKIILKDRFGYQDIVEGTLPTGQSVWTEYKDRVDFLKITRNNKEVYPNIYSTSEEIIVGKWINNKPIYRKVIELTTVAGTNYIARNSIANNIDIFTKIDGITIQPNSGNIVAITYYFNEYDFSGFYVNDVNIGIRCGSNYGFGETKLVLEYTKKTD